MENNNINYVVADWTNRDKEILKVLNHMEEVEYLFMYSGGLEWIESIAIASHSY